MKHRLTMRAATVAATLGLLLALVATPAVAAKPGTTEGESVPSAMVSLGDSITRGFNACGWFYDCTSRSWSTGAGNGVTSHFERLQALDPTMQSAYNRARSGAKMGELAAQADNAVATGAGYVTILMGANDACTSSESTMTPVADYRAQFEAAMTTLSAGLPDAQVFVASVPDIYRLWYVGKDSSSARYAWSTYGICQSMLENPTSTSEEDEARRQRVRQRVIDFNAQLAEVCAAHADCRFDDNVTFSYPFELDHLSGWDYFHPNTTGQNILAEQTWAVGFTWAKAAKGNGGGKKK
jgi:lysophospholipase L1-like esterase